MSRNITLVHIAGELLAIGGVTFYFYRKTSALENELKILKEHIESLEDSHDELEGKLNQLMMLVTTNIKNQQQAQSQITVTPIPQSPPQQDCEGGSCKVRKPVKKRKKKQPPPVRNAESESSSGEEPYDDDDLDSVLMSEVERMEESRNHCSLIEMDQSK